MTRSVDEWFGKNDDTPIPPRVKLRVFERHGGICYLTGRKIRPGDAWDCDHVLALCNGGQNRETNLAPAIRDAHRAKTAIDVDLKAKADRIKAKHFGIKQPSRGGFDKTKTRRFDGQVIRRFTGESR